MDDVKYEYGCEVTSTKECPLRKEIRADAIDELKTELIDIIYGNEEFTEWQKQEISLCLECAIEELKEQKDD